MINDANTLLFKNFRWADPHRHQAMHFWMPLCDIWKFVSTAQRGLFCNTILTPNVIFNIQSHYFVEHLSAAKYGKYYGCLTKTDKGWKGFLMKFPLLCWHNIKHPIAMSLLHILSLFTYIYLAGLFRLGSIRK